MSLLIEGILEFCKKIDADIRFSVIAILSVKDMYPSGSGKENKQEDEVCLRTMLWTFIRDGVFM
jgi:hypothetical protein